MAGTYNLFDAQWLTNQESESDPRARSVNVLQIHHAATTSTAGARSLMDPGGRTVSSNGLLDPSGFLYEVVLANRRAYTSATSFDHQSITVETVNTTGAPGWGISEAARTRLAQLAVDMFRAGLLGSLTRAHIIGHNEVPGTYATACPGPDMHLDWIVTKANEIYNGTGTVSVAFTQAQKSRKQAEMIYGFIQNDPKFGGTGAIYILNKETNKAKPIRNLGEWYAYEQQGWKYAPLAPKDFNFILSTYEAEK